MINGSDARLAALSSLLATLLMLSALRSGAACGENDTCMCVDDAECKEHILSEQPCLCQGGTHGSWEAVVKAIKNNNGVIQSLYLSGPSIDSL